MREAARHPSQRNILPPAREPHLSERPDLSSKRPMECDDVN
jgi:hypothetical protein